VRRLSVLLAVFAAVPFMRGEALPGIVSISPQQCVWRAGDDPAWAAPTLKESGWQPLTQWEAHSYQSHLWMRCHIDPAALRTLDHPAVQVRLLAAYQVFLNGVSIGRNGDLKNGLFSMDSIRLFPFLPSLAVDRSSILSLRVVFRMVSAGAIGSLQAPEIRLGGLGGSRNDRAAVLVGQFSEEATSFLPLVVIGIVGLVLLGFSAWDRTHPEPILLGLSCIFVGLMFVNVLCGTLMTREPVWAQLVLYSFSGTANLLAQTSFFFALARKRVPAIFRLLIGVWFVCAAWPLAELLLRPQLALRLDAIHFSVIAPVSYFLLAILLGLGPFIAFWPYRQIPRRMQAVAVLSAAWGAVLIVFFFTLAVEPFPGTSNLFEAWQSTLFPAQSIAQLCMVGAIIAFVLRDQRQIALQRASLAGEMQAASEIQHMLAPASIESASGLSVEVAFHPMREVGGDFFLCRVLPDGRQRILIGDVSGKGAAAAMAATLLLGAGEERGGDLPRELLAHLNQVLCRKRLGGFATCLCADVAPDGRTTIANAGHLAPYLNGSELKIDSGLPLGIIDHTDYSERPFQLAAGDTLTFLSDGVVEARNSSGELFGFDRSHAISTRTAEEIAAAAQSFGQQDDIAVLTLTFAPAEVVHA
jgi:Stage II sporulation protein E (SpoIIE)